jgi:hypothetical protein
MVLKTLAVVGRLHDCGIVRRIVQVRGHLLAVNLYSVLLKQGWLSMCRTLSRS